mmetsp:Transcript_14788/g.26549  ORF Transcript_14788/g.26549 Transcript_14788/m.26549 type:complete len:342 (+) Transcript_14788:3-1028(+)
MTMTKSSSSPFLRLRLLLLLVGWMFVLGTTTFIQPVNAAAENMLRGRDSLGNNRNNNNKDPTKTSVNPNKQEEEEEDETTSSQFSEDDQDENKTGGGTANDIAIIHDLNPEELTRCLQRKDLEEVFGKEMGVVCTCITAAPVLPPVSTTTTSSSAKQEPTDSADDSAALDTIEYRLSTAADNNNNDEGGRRPVSTPAVTIVVQLSCTDSRSRLTPLNSNGQFQFCLAKDEPCDPSFEASSRTAPQCCGSRTCSLQRQRCVASTDERLRDPEVLRLGGPSQNGNVRDEFRDNDNEEGEDQQNNEKEKKYENDNTNTMEDKEKNGNGNHRGSSTTQSKNYYSP